MVIPQVEGITEDQWKAMDGYFNRVPKRFFYFISVNMCVERFKAINTLREIDAEKAKEREARFFSLLGYTP